MGIHEAVFPAEERGALGALEIGLRPAMILHGPVKQMRAVGAEQVLFDDVEMMPACCGVSMPFIMACIIGSRL